MEKYNLEPTEDNIISSINGTNIRRDAELIDFIKLLDNIEGNFFISIDGEWGSGKTFFVKQLELVLKYYRNISYGRYNSEDVNKAIENNQGIKDLELRNIFLPIYYNAWLYDNHSDPILSLIYSITKSFEIGTKQSDINGKLLKVIQSINFWHLNDIANIFEALQGKSIIEEISSLESVKDQIKEILNDLITENGTKLIIMIDELDRCKPNFAVDLLERIKHFLNDDRIIFILAVNKSQLVHTISHNYGVGFNSSLYLNKFFDLDLKLEDINTYVYAQSMGKVSRNSYFFNIVTYDVLKYMGFSIRDSNIYIQHLSNIQSVIHAIGSGYGLLYSIFIPIIVAYRITDVVKSRLIESGQGMEYIEAIINYSESMQKMIKKFATKQDDSGWDEFHMAYDVIFNNQSQQDYYSGQVEVNRSMKNEIIKLCNTYK